MGISFLGEKGREMRGREGNKRCKHEGTSGKRRIGSMDGSKNDLKVVHEKVRNGRGEKGRGVGGEKMGRRRNRRREPQRKEDRFEKGR